MFYEGDLRSGINTAIEQSKLVACYVRGQEDGEETTAWENEFLKEQEVADLISSKAVLLRLLSPSEEASFLEQICPIVKLPTLVVIHNGAMKEYLTSGISKEEFINRLTPVLKGEETSFSPTSSIPAAAQTGAGNSNQNQQTNVAALLQERKIRMEAEKKKKDAEEKAERVRKAAERKAAIEAGQPEDPKRAADLKYAAMQKKKQQEARQERERVLKQIEDDKAERKARDAARKEQAKIAAGTEPNPFTAPSSEMGSIRRADHCALKVRLFDGSAISSRFPSEATLEGEVRKWVDQEQQVAESPYTFKHILTPFPNKEISISEEGKSLQDLGLVPNATLVLVPVKDFTPAYGQGPGVTGLLSSGVSMGYGLVSSGLTSGLGFASRVLGSVVGDSSQGEPPADAPPPPQELRRNERHELYNGGGLNFEPRRDNQDKED
ncbi:hypothetical protein V491_09035 [Pseudogymnoascus sp. VKM F-3775]|nr:hypothetical protein V491_09035 [Pseudogymnoascus sp. VKM F-3775]